MHILRFLKKQSTARIIALGFALTIFLGSLLLMLPFSIQDGVQLRYIDALYTSVSAVCVTGLVVIDPGDTFSPFGQSVLAVLIQIGGLGVAAIGAGIMLAIGRKVNLKGRTLIQDAMNLQSGRGVVLFIRDIFFTTVIFEAAGAALSFPVFVRDFPPLKAAWISLFHSIAAFNNSGFDILGNSQNLIPYSHNVMLNLVTMALIIAGGIGFLVIRDLIDSRFRWRRLSMHSRIVISTSAVLIVSGAVLLRLTEDITWMGAFFSSISARTAGFSTFSLGNFTRPGLLVMMFLMLVGASPGSTGGGIKTSTLFVLAQGIKSAATNTTEKAFRYALPKDAFRKSAVIFLLALSIIFCSSYLFLLLEPSFSMEDILFEMTSAFGTAGLSTGITPQLGIPAKLLSMVIMYIGRLGPLTIATLWHFTLGERIRFPEGNIAIG